MKPTCNQENKVSPFSYDWGFVVPHTYGGLRIMPGTESLAMGLRCLGSLLLGFCNMFLWTIHPRNATFVIEKNVKSCMVRFPNSKNILTDLESWWGGLCLDIYSDREFITTLHCRQGQKFWILNRACLLALAERLGDNEGLFECDILIIISLCQFLTYIFKNSALIFFIKVKTAHLLKS